MKYCSKHHANPDDAIFCNECGEKLFVSHKETNKCPNCNTENPIDAEFCHECGKRLSLNEAPSKPSSIKVPTTTSSNNKDNILGLIVAVGFIVFVVLIIIGLIGKFVDLIRLIGLILS